MRLSSPGSESERLLGAYVRLLQNAVAGVGANDEQARYNVYRRALDFLSRRLRERNDLSQSDMVADLQIFAEAALYVERKARSFQSVLRKAEVELTPADFRARRKSNAKEFATSEKAGVKPAAFGSLAQPRPPTEPPVQGPPRSQGPREFKVSGPRPHRSSSRAGDPVQTAEP